MPSAGRIYEFFVRVEAEAVIHLVRDKSVVHKEVVVVAENRQVLRVGIVGTIHVFRGYPTVESLALDYFVPQMPLPIVRCVVAVGNHVRHRLDARRQRDVVHLHAACVRPQAGQERRTRRGANGRGYIGVFEYETLIGEGVQIRGLNQRVAVARQGVETLLVGQDEQDIRLIRHFELRPFLTTPSPVVWSLCRAAEAGRRRLR